MEKVLLKKKINRKISNEEQGDFLTKWLEQARRSKEITPEIYVSKIYFWFIFSVFFGINYSEILIKKNEKVKNRSLLHKNSFLFLKTGFYKIFINNPKNSF